MLRLTVFVVVLKLLVGTAQAGTFSSADLTGDADSGIDPGRTYTHAVDLFRVGEPPLVINDVPFHAGLLSGTDLFHGGSYSLSTATEGNNTHDTLVAGDVGDMLDDFYHTRGTNGSARLELSGLTPGVEYVTTWYCSAWGMGGRSVRITGSDDGSHSTFDEDRNGTGNGLKIMYAYTAAETGTIAYDFDAVDNYASFHHYGFSNAAVPEPSTLALLGIGAAGLLIHCLRKRS